MDDSRFQETPELSEFTYWNEHADYPVEDWQHEVADGNTRLGYWDWVLVKFDQEEEDDHI